MTEKKTQKIKKKKALMPKFGILYCVAIQNIQNKLNSLTYLTGI